MARLACTTSSCDIAPADLILCSLCFAGEVLHGWASELATNPCAIEACSPDQSRGHLFSRGFALRVHVPIA